MVDEKLKTIAIFGSTGSIGAQTLNVVRRFPHKYKVVALSAGNNVELLKKQIAEFKPNAVSCTAPCDLGVKTFPDAESLADECNADVYVMAISGFSALPPLMRIVKKGKRIALANKEAIVSAGEVVTDEAKKYGSEIIPVDSEHSAVFQCLKVGEKKNVKKIILTASGGPFYTSNIDLEKVTPEDALKHPTWNMGSKISIDSATMVNKGLEIIEANRLFGGIETDYVIHPDSIIHSLVEYEDNATVALMSYPNMELAISYALTYPERIDCGGVKAFDFSRNLTFVPKDERRFPAPALAKECVRIGGTAPAIYCIADEVAVGLFMKKIIKFTDIYGIIEDALGINEIGQDITYCGLLDLESRIKSYYYNKYGVK